MFDFLKARPVPYHRVREHKQQQVASYLASVLPPEHHFPPKIQPFSMEDKLVSERLKRYAQEEFSIPGPWRWHYYWVGQTATLD